MGFRMLVLLLSASGTQAVLGLYQGLYHWIKEPLDTQMIACLVKTRQMHRLNNWGSSGILGRTLCHSAIRFRALHRNNLQNFSKPRPEPENCEIRNS